MTRPVATMVAPERSALSGIIEVDDAYIGGTDSGRLGGRDAFGAGTIVITAVEVRGNRSGRIEMEAVDDLSADALRRFVQDNVVEGATMRTDAWQGFKRLGRLGYEHQATSLRAGGMVGMWLRSRLCSGSVAGSPRPPTRRSRIQARLCGAMRIRRTPRYRQLRELTITA